MISRIAVAFSTVLFLNRSVILRAWSKPSTPPDTVVKERKAKRKAKKNSLKSGESVKGVESVKGIESVKRVESVKGVESVKRVENVKRVESIKSVKGTEKVIKEGIKRMENKGKAVKTVKNQKMEMKPESESWRVPVESVTEKKEKTQVPGVVKNEDRVESEIERVILSNSTDLSSTIIEEVTVNYTTEDTQGKVEIVSTEEVKPPLIQSEMIHDTNLQSGTPSTDAEETIPLPKEIPNMSNAPVAPIAPIGVVPSQNRSSTPSSTDSNQQVDKIHQIPSHSREWQSDLSSQFSLHPPSFPSGPAQRRPHQHTPPPQPDVPANIPKFPQFSSYGVTFSMHYVITSPNDSVFVLLRSLPPQVDSQGAERVMVGNRSIFGWKLSQGEDMCWSRELIIEVENGIKRSVSTPSLIAMRK